MPVRVIGFDGDDTLWHSETRFHVTQGEFRDLLARHAPDADVDRRLAEMEMKNLAIYGYGVKSFTLSMLETAIELTEGKIPAADLEVVLGWGKRMLMEPTELLDGVEATLRGLSGSYDLLLITKGDLFDQGSAQKHTGRRFGRSLDQIIGQAMAVRAVGFDGDDTLWHSETRFNLTQDEFRDLVHRHVPDAEVDARLAQVEQQNLSIYGYGVKSFTLSMVETAIELTKGRIPASDLEVVLGWGKRMLMEPTELLNGVEQTLRELAGRYDLLLVTKGDLFDQESKLARSGLAELFLGVEIVSEKSVDTYRAILRRRGIVPEEFVMVGNSLRSDIAPVVKLGGQAVHIPYEVTWHHEHVPEDQLPSRGWSRIDVIDGLPAVLASL